MSWLRDSRGFTLVEVLTVMLLMTIILGATLTTLDRFARNSHINQRQNEAQQENRRALDRMAKELRNLASPTDERPLALERAEPDEIVFQSVNRTPDAGGNAYNTRRIRYCLNNGTKQLIRQSQIAPGDTIPPAADCAAGTAAGEWSPGVVVAEHVVNGTRPVWYFHPVLASPPNLSTVTSIRAELFVDINPNRKPAESRLVTGVQLRNQNRRPIADFTADSPEPGKVVLNASPSIDPEGRALSYFWYMDTSAPENDQGPPKPINEQISYTCCDPPLAPGSYPFTLKVRDPAGLSSVATKMEVVVK